MPISRSRLQSITETVPRGIKIVSLTWRVTDQLEVSLSCYSSIPFFFQLPKCNRSFISDLFFICLQHSHRMFFFLSLLVIWDKGRFYSALFFGNIKHQMKLEAEFECYILFTCTNKSAQIVPLKINQDSGYLMSLYQPWVLHAHISKHSTQRQYGRWLSSVLIVYWPNSNLAFIDDANKTINLLTSLACHILIFFFF